MPCDLGGAAIKADLSDHGDLALADMSPSDLSSSDLATSAADMAVPADFAMPDDLALPRDLAIPNDLALPRDLRPPPPDLAGEHLSVGFVPTIAAGRPYSISVQATPAASIPVALTVVSGPGAVSGTSSGMTDSSGNVMLQPQFDRAGNYVIVATSPDAADSAAVSFRVAGVPHWTVQPHDITGGTVESPSPTVTLIDGTGAVDTTDGDVVSLVRAFDSPCEEVSGWVTTVQGVAAFDNLAVNAACSGYRLNASLEWGAEESVPFNVTVGPAAKLVVVQLDTPLVVGEPFRVRVEVTDAGGNVVSVPATPITLSLTGATLGGTTTQTTAGSVATFDGLTIDRAGHFTLAAAGGGWSGTFQLDVSAWELRSTNFTDLMAVDDGDPDEVYFLAQVSEVWQSVDGAATFTFMGALPYGETRLAMALDPLTASRLYVAGAAGFFRSDNGGVSFVATGAGLPADLSGAALAVDRRTADIYVLQAGTLWRSSDGAATFSALTPSVTNVRAFAIDPQTSALWVGGDGALWTSSDLGASWADRSAALPSPCSAQKIMVSPIASATLFVSCAAAGSATIGITTTNGATSWTALSGPPAYGVVVDAGGTWYAADAVADQLWKSADGVSWRSVQMLDSILTAVPVPGQPGWLYGVAANGVYRTKTGGE